VRKIAHDVLEINRPKTPRVESIDDLANLPRWVAWREETRERQDGSKYQTKIPYDPNRLNAQARIPTEPATWGTRAQAERRWHKLDQDGKCRGGIGIVLGDLGDGYYLLGIDLDQCLKPARKQEIVVEPFINKIIDRFNTYAEVSPSGQGIKLFFLVAEQDIDEVQDLLGFENGKPKTRKTFAAGKHLEIAIDRARYYAVTEEWLDDLDTFRVVPFKDVRWFIAEAGPWFQQLHRKPGDEQIDTTRDESGSGYGYRFFASCKALGKTFEQAWQAIQNDRGKAGDWARRVDTRQLGRAWDKAPPYLYDDFVKPKLQALTPPVSARELKDMTFPPLKYVVPDVIVEGLSIFAGKPKVGKSWMMLHIANAVARGGSTLGGIQCEPGNVLYCALEDTFRRLQSRMHKMGVQHWSKHLEFRTELPRLDEGGLDIIRQWVKSVRRPRLVIIDTFKRVRPRTGGKETQYSDDYEAVMELHALASECGIAIVVVHHLRKADADDIYDTVSGTFGLTGGVDTIMILNRDKNGIMVFHARGRDLDQLEKAMVFNRDTCRWKIAGDVEEFRQSRQRTAIINAMRELGRPAKPNEIAIEAQLNPANVSKLVVKMSRDGMIYRHGYGEYWLRRPGSESESPEG
jgi:hypothetical protein